MSGLHKFFSGKVVSSTTSGTKQPEKETIEKKTPEKSSKKSKRTLKSLSRRIWNGFEIFTSILINSLLAYLYP